MPNSLRSRSVSAFMLLSAVVLVPCAMADNVSVDCSGTNPNAFHTITSALSALSLAGPNSIGVSGVCHENVSIAQRDRLSIYAAGGQNATIVAADPSQITLLVAGSHNIVLDQLNIQGGSPALYVTAASSPVLIQSCVIQNSVADGMDIDAQSTVTIQDSTIKNNSAVGIFIANQSQMTLGTYPNQRISITGNGFGGNGNGSDGLNIDGSQVQLNFGVLTMSGNKGSGISMQGGRLQLYGGESDTPAIIDGNSNGIWMNGDASATLWSGFRISNNGNAGVSASGDSSVTFYSTIDSKGLNAVSTIEGNAFAGIVLSQSSSAQMYGAHVVSGNGTAGGYGGGMVVGSGSLTVGGGTQVTGNIGTGVSIGPKSDLIMFNMSVTHNTQAGVVETNLSTGGFYDPLDLSRNGGGSLRCDRFSVAFGDASKIPGSQCENVPDSVGHAPEFHPQSRP